MSNAIELERSRPDALAPAPRAVRAGDYVFTSSIYPVHDAGVAVANDPRLGETGPSLMAAQTRTCVERLQSVLSEFGASLDHVLKADVHLANADDYYEFKQVWKESFPQNPPARTTVAVGDTLPIPGALLNIDCVALAGSSQFDREVLADPEGSDPLDVEWASHAVRAGRFVFCSAFPANDFETGLAVGRPPYGVLERAVRERQLFTQNGQP